MSRELLPWYVNGTLAADERVAAERALDEAEARAELELWRAVATQVAAEEIESNAGGVDLGWLRLQRQLEPQPARSVAPLWRRAAAAAVLALLGGETIYLVHTQRTHDAQMRQLGAQPGGIRAGEWRVQVRFRAEATIAEIDSLLLDVNARVIDGPSALGIYELAVPRSERFPDAAHAARWLGEQSIVEQSSAPP